MKYSYLLDGTTQWISAESMYTEKIQRIENQLIDRLRINLLRCKNATEMFRVFSKINALLVRPKIRSAIQEYQNQLIENVKEDIKMLQDKFKMNYIDSQASKMAKLRDIPQVSGAIM